MMASSLFQNTPPPPPRFFAHTQTPPSSSLFQKQHPHSHHDRPRFLDSNGDDDFTTYLVDLNGNPYEEPYALSWRYLGMYIDCDMEEAQDEEEEEEEEESGSGDEDERRTQRRTQQRRTQQKQRYLSSGEDNDCSRKLLWAAYQNPRYEGGSIGEYKFYDWKTDTWDDSTCQTKHCTRMDCHESRTKFKLIGVFKETDGMYDWAEQLFKHQGYCVWNGDKDDESGDSAESGDEDEDEEENEAYEGSGYEFMQEQLEKWVDGCTQMGLSDSNGNTLYLNTKPQAEGNMTYGMYYDEDCTEDADSTFADYVLLYYSTYYYDEEAGEEAAAYWESSFERWNMMLNTYKVCQPCRAYNRVPTYSDDDDEDEDDDDNNDNDGEGEAEQWGYNCYDDAGYRNCDQCYKFETQTSLEEASISDLQRASAQGTILAIRVNGRLYGQGGFVSDPEPLPTAVFITLIAGLILLGVAILYRMRTKVRNFINFLRSRRQKFALPASLQEVFPIETQEVVHNETPVPTVNDKKTEVSPPKQTEEPKPKSKTTTTPPTTKEAVMKDSKPDTPQNTEGAPSKPPKHPNNPPQKKTESTQAQQDGEQLQTKINVSMSDASV